MLDKVKINDLIKIVGRSYVPLKEKDIHLVLNKIENENSYTLFLLRENGETFWTYFEKRDIVKKDGDIIILN